MARDVWPIKETILTLGIGGVGALCFWLIGLPAAFLTGPAACVTIAALSGLQVHIPKAFSSFCFIVIGVGIGLGVTPEVMQAALSWPISFAILAVVQWLSILLGAWLLLRLFHFDRDDAVISAVPGLLSFIVSLAVDRGANVSRVSFVQSVRVLVLALLVPVLLKIWGMDDSVPVPAIARMSPPVLIPLMIAVWAFGALLGKWGVPASYILAGVIFGSISSLTGIANGAMPVPLSVVAFVIIGSLIGTRFRGRRPNDIGDDVKAGLVITFSAAIIALIGAWVVSGLLQISLAPLLIAFAPGGLEVMIAMSVQLGLDPTFVAAHHVARLLILMALVTVMLGRTKGG